MQTLPPAALDHVHRYLSSSGIPFDPAGHLATHAPNALLLVGRHLRHRRELDANDYDERLQAFLAERPDEASHPTFTWIELQDWQEDPEGASVLVSLREETSGRTVQGAFRLQRPDWTILGACLVQDELPEAAELISRCLAELAACDPCPSWGPRPLTGLMAAYLRLHEPPADPLRILPEARFTCQGRGDCCSIESWGITLNQNASKALQAIPWRDLDLPGPSPLPPKAAATAEGEPAWRLQPSLCGMCTAYTGGKCSVHLVTGWQPIATCQVFPFRFIETPDGIDVTLTYTCLTVGENKGRRLRAQQPELRQRLHPVRHDLVRIPACLWLTPDGPAIDWPAYRDIETQLLAILEGPSHGSLHDRLLAGHRLVAGMLGEHDLQPTSSAQADQLFEQMRRPGDHERPDWVLGGFDPEAWAISQRMATRSGDDVELITRYLRNLLFRKQGLPEFGIAFLWGSVALTAKLWERECLYRSHQAGRTVDREIQLQAARACDMFWQHGNDPNALTRVEPLKAIIAQPQLWMSLLAT